MHEAPTPIPTPTLARAAARWPVLPVLLVLLLCACSTPPVNYRDIELLPPLEVPADLQPPRTDTRMAIPGLSLTDVEAVRRRLAAEIQQSVEEIEAPPEILLSPGQSAPAPRGVVAPPAEAPATPDAHGAGHH